MLVDYFAKITSSFIEIWFQNIRLVLFRAKILMEAVSYPLFKDKQL